MKVLYDHQAFVNQTYGGVSRYFFEIMRDSLENEEAIALSLKYSNNIYIRKLSLARPGTFFERLPFRGRSRLLNGINKTNSIINLRRQRFDVFHPTYYDPYFLDHIGDKPFVLTIHDMIHELFPSMFSVGDNTAARKKYLAEKAARIIAVSENTKRDIVKMYGIGEEKIEVVYHGNSLNSSAIGRVSSLRLPENYLLFVGDRHIYKNFQLFVRSVAAELRGNRDMNIVCGGGKEFLSEELQLFSALDIGDQVYHYPHIDDKTLANLYRNATAFVFPSLYEGFGIPILEAFSCGCPVVASNVSSLPEVAGDAAIYFNPCDAASIQDAVRKMAYEDDLREQMRGKGYKRLRQFSWTRAAEQTRAVYLSCV